MEQPPRTIVGSGGLRSSVIDPGPRQVMAHVSGLTLDPAVRGDDWDSDSFDSIRSDPTACPDMGLDIERIKDLMRKERDSKLERHEPSESGRSRNRRGKSNNIGSAAAMFLRKPTHCSKSDASKGGTKCTANDEDSETDADLTTNSDYGSYIIQECTMRAKGAIRGRRSRRYEQLDEESFFPTETASRASEGDESRHRSGRKKYSTDDLSWTLSTIERQRANRHGRGRKHKGGGSLGEFFNHDVSVSSETSRRTGHSAPMMATSGTKVTNRKSKSGPSVSSRASSSSRRPSVPRPKTNSSPRRSSIPKSEMKKPPASRGVPAFASTKPSSVFQPRVIPNDPTHLYADRKKKDTPRKAGIGNMYNLQSDIVLDTSLEDSQGKSAYTPSKPKFRNVHLGRCEL